MLHGGGARNEDFKTAVATAIREGAGARFFPVDMSSNAGFPTRFIDHLSRDRVDDPRVRIVRKIIHAHGVPHTILFSNGSNVTNMPPDMHTNPREYLLHIMSAFDRAPVQRTPSENAPLAPKVHRAPGESSGAPSAPKVHRVPSKSSGAPSAPKVHRVPSESSGAPSAPKVHRVLSEESQRHRGPPPPPKIHGPHHEGPGAPRPHHAEFEVSVAPPPMPAVHGLVAVTPQTFTFMVMLHLSWCGHCQRLLKEVWTPQYQSELRQQGIFIFNCEVDTSEGGKDADGLIKRILPGVLPEGETVPLGFPMLAMLKHDGKSMHAQFVSGYKPEDEYRREVAQKIAIMCS